MHLDLSRALPDLANVNPYMTDDLDAAREHISELFVPHRLDVVGCDQVLDVHISQAQIEGVSLIYHRHGASVRVRPEPLRNYFLLQIPIRGEAFVTVNKHDVYCHSKQAVMISPTSGVDMRFGEGCEQLIVRIDKGDLDRHLEQHLGREIELPVEFNPTVPLGTTGGREITSLLQFMTAALTQDTGGMGCSKPAREHMASLLISGLISCLDHNYQEDMAACDSDSRPAYVARAQKFIKENLREPITPEDIAAAANVSTRALFGGFKTCLGTTPMRYLKEARLDMVRRELSNSEAYRTSVTNVAMKYGFLHLGHFCSAYKQKFGESPRDTLTH